MATPTSQPSSTDIDFKYFGHVKNIMTKRVIACAEYIHARGHESTASRIMQIIAGHMLYVAPECFDKSEWVQIAQEVESCFETNNDHAGMREYWVNLFNQPIPPQV